MPKTVRQVRLFVASPGDVPDERDAVDAVADDLRHSLGAADLDVRVLRWERDTYPALGDRAQALVSQQLGIDEVDVFVGIMWKRFGQPTGEAGSGTEEEFNQALSRYQKTGRPPILFYFCERPFFPRSDEEMRQFEKVRAFRERVQGLGLVGTYTTPEDFTRKLRRALDRTIREVAETDEGVAVSSPPSDPAPNAPAAPARFADIPLPDRRASTTDLDKRRFLRDGFATVVSYFEDAAEALRQSNPAFEVDIEQETSRAFRVAVFENGQSQSQCRIWISDTMGDSIAYVEGSGLGSFSGSQMNDYGSPRETEEGLAFALSGMDFSTTVGQTTTAEGLARHFWTRFTRPLDTSRRIR